MSTRNLIRAIQKLPRRTRKLSARLTKGFFAWLLRRLYVLWHRPTTSTAGFVLPTTVLLLLMVALTAGALTYRSFSRSEQAIAKRQQQVITNSATPAVNRAQSKLEFLFLKDDRFPGGVPSSNVLQSMMLDDGDNGVTPKGGDPYTLPDETRIDLDGDNATLENAWVFSSDVNGDGTVAADELVVYSILMDDQTVDGSGNPVFSADDPQEPDKAKAMVTRNGPITTTEPGTNCNAARAPEGGWTVLGNGNASVLQKNFQIDAFVRNGSDVNRTVETLEFQQIREAARGNKWGAWFRNDLEVFPASSTIFNWNGAMHTEGSLIASSTFRAHMISSKDSCLYGVPASEISIKFDPANGYRGEFVLGEIGTKDAFSGNGGNADEVPNIHYDNNGNPVDNFPMRNNGNNNRDSVDAGTGSNPSDVGLNPIALFTEGELEHNDDSTWTQDANFETQNNAALNGRIFFDNISTVPTLDDFYRSDDRWGPVASYSGSITLPTTTPPTFVGDEINGNATLTETSSGLDGYWERRAIATGLRLIVGQRLELGNAFGWHGNNDPLYPATTAEGNTTIDNNVWFPGPNETRQFRSLRDNLAAVQGMVVYHYQGNGGAATDGTTPLACYAMTAHPGTLATIENSRTFSKYTDTPGAVEYYKSDFLSGVGTNGWEFTYPFGSTDYASAQPLGDALRNLATFAGDPEGGAPAFPAVQEAAGGQVHPLPYLSMWGDYSMLNRLLDGAFAAAYTSASSADKTIYESAACTLGLLSYDITALERIAADLLSSSGPLATLATTLNTSFAYGAGDEERVLEQWLDKFSAIAGLTPAQQELVNERLILMSQYFQQIRDRAYGFSPIGTIDTAGPSGFAGSVTAPNSGPYAGQNVSVSCDPTLFSSVTADAAEQLTLALVLCPSTSVLPNRVVRYPALYYLFPFVDHDYADGQPAGSEDYIDENASTVFNTPDPARFKAVNPEFIVTRSTTPGQPLEFKPQEIGSWVMDTSASLGPVGITVDPTGTQPVDVNQIVAPDGNTYNIPMLDKGMYDGRENMGLRMLDLDLNLLTKQKNGSGDYWIPADTNGGAEGIVYAFREDAVREDEIVRPFGNSWPNCDSVATLTNNGSDSTVNPPTVGTIGSCQMDVFAPQDPPLNDDTGISPKPVDFYADPDRRPYGFRMKNGIDVSDGNSRDVGMTFITDNSVYIYGDFNLHSTDGVNPNLEEFTNPLLSLTVDGTTYTTDFYNRVAADLDTNRFAAIAQDHWRPVELLADAVGILSANFKDGAIVDGFTEISVATPSSGLSSYQNQDRPYFTTNPGQFDYGRWYHENPLDNTGTVGTTPNSPILVPRNGNYYIDKNNTTGGDPLIGDGATSSDRLFDINGADVGQSANRNTSDVDWISFIHKTTAESPKLQEYRQHNMIGATPTYANAVMISGIVPSRPFQSYGGLHNFPRLLERWSSANALYISGAFFQLNFSTGSTGPYDADAWEPQQGPRSGGGNQREFNHYYGAPDRRWGYDVGLQYVSPAPISRRFVSVGAPRSEYYRELPSDDPYMMLLRCARNDSSGAAIITGGERIDQSADAACIADYGL